MPFYFFSSFNFLLSCDSFEWQQFYFEFKFLELENKLEISRYWVWCQLISELGERDIYHMVDTAFMESSECLELLGGGS